MAKDMKNFYLVWLGTMSLLICSTNSSSVGGVTMAFCKTTTVSSARDDHWKDRIQEVLLQIPFRVDPVDCGGPIEAGGMGVSIRFHDLGKKETVIRQKDQSDSQFLTTIISKIVPERLSPIKSSLKETLSGVKEAFVVYIVEDTNGEAIFQQLLVTIDIPKSIKVFKVTNKAFFPPNMQKTIKEEIHVWIIMDHPDGQQMSHVPLPYSRPTKITLYIGSVITRLKLPYKVKYETDEVYSQYEGVNFNFFTVYHHTNQEEELYRNIINPLSNIFRPFYVFVSVDIDKFVLPATVDPDSSIPLIVVTKAGQRVGLPINSNDIPYTVEGLKTILNTIVDPEIDKDSTDDNLFGKKSDVDLVIPTSIPSLTTATVEEFITSHDTCILGFYLPYTLASRMFLHHFIAASEELKSAGMPIGLVNCANYPDICETFDINQFPSSKYRQNGGDWIAYKGVLSNSQLVRLARGQPTYNDKETDLMEMNPFLLMKLLKNDGRLTTLALLVADDVMPGRSDALSNQIIYWLNCTRHPKLSNFLTGLTRPPHIAPPPVLVWADYTKNLLYRLILEPGPLSLEKGEIREFFTDAANGNRPPDSAIIPAGWKPISPPIAFPSNHFLATFSFSDDEKNLGLIDKQPLYADPNGHSFNRPSSSQQPEPNGSPPHHHMHIDSPNHHNDGRPPFPDQPPPPPDYHHNPFPDQPPPPDYHHNDRPPFPDQPPPPDYHHNDHPPFPDQPPDYHHASPPPPPNHHHTHPPNQDHMNRPDAHHQEGEHYQHEEL